MSISADSLAQELRVLLPKLEPANPAADVAQPVAAEAVSVPVMATVEGAAAPNPAAPAVAVAPLDPCQVLELNVKGVHLDVRAPSSGVVAVAHLMDARGFALDAVTGVDWIAEREMEVVYDYLHPLSGLRVAVHARVPRETPVIPSIQGVFPGANWHERETHDFFGIRFEGHPDLSPFLLPEDADYHPLRKDFAP